MFTFIVPEPYEEEGEEDEDEGDDDRRDLFSNAVRLESDPRFLVFSKGGRQHGSSLTIPPLILIPSCFPALAVEVAVLDALGMKTELELFAEEDEGRLMLEKVEEVGEVVLLIRDVVEGSLILLEVVLILVSSLELVDVDDNLVLVVGVTNRAKNRDQKTVPFSTNPT